jgi:hypothetical protein
VSGERRWPNRRPRSRPSSWRRWLRWSLLALLLCLVVVTVDSWQAVGTSATGDRLARMLRSSQYRDGQFNNLLLTQMDEWEAMKKWLAGGSHQVPTGPLPVAKRIAADFVDPPSDGLRLTWLGHSTLLVEIDGHRLLTDPQWSNRESPTRFAGPVRFFDPPLALADLPELDAVLISHDH